MNTGGGKLAKVRSKAEGSVQAAKAANGESNATLIAKAKAIT